MRRVECWVCRGTGKVGGPHPPTYPPRRTVDTPRAEPVKRCGYCRGKKFLDLPV